MLNKIFVATVYIRFDMFHQVVITETIQTFIIVPMAIACTFSIDLYNFRAHCDFNLFNGIEDKRTQSAVKTIKVYDVFEMNIFTSEVVFGILTILLERISVSTKSIVANIKKISDCLAFIIENESPLFKSCNLLGECQRLLDIIYSISQFNKKLPCKNSKTSPGALFFGKRGRSYQMRR